MIHRVETICQTRANNSRYWVATCDCGWRGDEHDYSGSGLHRAATQARQDYVAHVEAELGAQAYYDVDAECRNCGSHHRQGVAVGLHVTSAACTRCGTVMLQPDHDVWHDTNERMRWFQ